MTPPLTLSTAIPCLHYRDAAAAIDWLCANLGFQTHVVYPSDDGSIAHAQLTLGGGMIMLGTVRDSEYGRLIKQPDEIGGFETQSVYLMVEDADAIYRQARAAGAEIVMEIKDEDYGGRGFSCRDPEGHLWNIGTYNPWTSVPQ